ncbi:MAG: hypothetical protein WBA12_10975 [Catalinimonas sp.]
MEEFLATLAGPGLIIAYILVGVCILAAIVLPLINSLSDPKSLLKVGLGVVVLAVVVFLGYALSGTEVTRIAAEAMAKQDLSDDTAKWISGGLIAMYIMLFLAVLSIVFTEVAGIFR